MKACVWVCGVGVTNICANAKEQFLYHFDADKDQEYNKSGSARDFIIDRSFRIFHRLCEKDLLA